MLSSQYQFVVWPHAALRSLRPKFTIGNNPPYEVPHLLLTAREARQARGERRRGYPLYRLALKLNGGLSCRSVPA